MKRFRSRYARRVLVPVMVVSLLSGCSYWHVQEMTPSQVVTEKEPDRVRLTMLDGARVELSEPQVVGSEILGKGKWDGDNSGRIPGEVFWNGADHWLRRIAIDSVSYVEIRKTDIAGIVALGILMAPVVAFVAFGICGAAGGCEIYGQIGPAQ